MSTSQPHQTSEIVEARVHRAPRWGVFLGIGVAAGVILAFLLTIGGSFEASVATQVSYPFGQVFGFLLLWTVPVGIAALGLVALILERSARRRERIVLVDRESTAE
ncbi:potassium transporter Trk [Microbacterium capsulatum]|uniref:Potassium transporter Trk n=1 Tax=Microbacterium capsulatum TaxID=3041921 RepID=A0ABU0XJL9_9MICO|nr:potassium transporter Trk [Microbacterium sp. ASV81]MDQ4215334.1 potassium transporter Trk [Microbacterium sp. ASV81]